MSLLGRLSRRRHEATAGAGDRPVLAVDVDGVVLLFGFKEPPQPPAARFEMVEGRVHCISVAGGHRLLRLARQYDLVWATGWEDRANRFGEMLGLPPYPNISFGRSARFGSADWKITPLQRYAAGRPLAWIDDSFDERCYDWARDRAEPTLLIPTDPAVGLDDVQEEALSGWARSLEAEPPRP